MIKSKIENRPEISGEKMKYLKEKYGNVLTDKERDIINGSAVEFLEPYPGEHMHFQTWKSFQVHMGENQN